MEYQLIRSGRKSLAIEVNRDGEVIIRAPQRMALSVIEEFVTSRRAWIEEKQTLMKNRAAAHPLPDAERLQALVRQAREILPGRVEHFSRIMDVRPAGITITAARTRFGSCSGKDRICFSCLLMDYPEEAIDYVVVHELAHIRHHNHSAQFWAVVESVLPDYRRRQAMLKE